MPGLIAFDDRFSDRFARRDGISPGLSGWALTDMHECANTRQPRRLRGRALNHRDASRHGNAMRGIGSALPRTSPKGLGWSSTTFARAMAPAWPRLRMCACSCGAGTDAGGRSHVIISTASPVASIGRSETVKRNSEDRYPRVDGPPTPRTAPPTPRMSYPVSQVERTNGRRSKHTPPRRVPRMPFRAAARARGRRVILPTAHRQRWRRCEPSATHRSVAPQSAPSRSMGHPYRLWARPPAPDVRVSYAGCFVLSGSHWPRLRG